MDQTSWHKIEELFNAALELPPEERAAFLEAACPGNDELKNEVQSLLAKTQTEDSFLEKPNLALGMNLLNQEKYLALYGEKLGRYKIVRLLGEGGMGEVYLAEDVSLNRLAALKLLPAYLIKDDESVVRFEKEALAASAISHPNIAHIYEAGVENDRRFIAMEYVDGTTLRDLLKQRKLDVIGALDIVLQIANALIAAHAAGIIHRDIKPENIMLRPDGYVKVLDFGVAKLIGLRDEEAETLTPSLRNNPPSAIPNPQLTLPGLMMGTISYISPEQLRHKKVDFRADIWSLGIVLYEMLAGRKPFAGKTSEAIRKAVLTKNPAPFSVPSINPENEDSLRNIMTGMLQKDAGRRYESAAALAKDLKELKQNLEFIRQLPASEATAEKILSKAAVTGEQTRENSDFLTRSRHFWSQRSLSGKVLLLAGLIGLLTFSFSISAQYFSRLYANKAPKPESFSPGSRGKLQISTLFSTKRKPNGMIRDVNFSPDGKWIAFTLAANDSSDIYVKEVEKGEPVKLTDGKWIYQSPVWSPDGQQLALASNRDHKSGIWTVSYLGGTPVFQTALEDTAGLTCYLRKWSNDERRIYYESCKKLYTIELDSGRTAEIPVSETEIVGDFNVARDEKMMTFVAVEDQKQRIFTQSLENGAFASVLKNDYHSWSPVFFPDQRRIAYSSNQNGISQIYVSDLTGSEASQITFGDINASVPIVSPDGKKMAYVSDTDEANIFSLDLKTGKETPETSNTKMQLFPNISPNNENMVFQSTDNESKTYASLLKIKKLGVESEPNQINLTGGGPLWSPKNDSFAFLKQSGIDINIWKTDLADLKEKQLTFGGIVVEGTTKSPYNFMSIPFDWSPDGKKIVYSSKQSGFYNLWSIDEDGGQPQMLTGNDNPKLRFSSSLWSPDGSRIAYVYRNAQEPKKIRYGISVLSNGESINLFESDSFVRLLGWSRTGNELLAAVENENDAVLVSISAISKAGPQTLANLKGGYPDSLILSPDGQKAAYSANRNGINNVFVVSVRTGGRESQMTSNLENTLYYSGITWSPDGTRLYYSKQSGGIQISMISDSD